MLSVIVLWETVLQNYFAIFALVCLAAVTSANAAPCDSPEYRQFDFWLGQWDVFKPDGTLAGQNEIRREYGSCVIHERYSTPRKYRGESLNSYDPAKKQWHQTWVDNAGTLLLLDGAFNGTSMVLSGTTQNADGSTTHQRIQWTPNADGSVRQLWQQSPDTKDWTVVFDGLYRRVEKPQSSVPKTP